MIGCGCGEKFKTQLAYNEHRRLKHLKAPTLAPPTPGRGKHERSAEWRARRSAAAKEQWQGADREKIRAAMRAGHRRRRERLEREKLAQVSLPPPAPQEVPATASSPFVGLGCGRPGCAAVGAPSRFNSHGPDGCSVNESHAGAVSAHLAEQYQKSRGEHLRRQLADAIAALVDFEVLRVLAAARTPTDVVKPPEPVNVPITPKLDRTIPLPRGDWTATRAVRLHKVEPVEKPPLPAPLPEEVETVNEPEEPENVHRNLGMRAAVAIAHRLGIRVRKNSSGEIEFAHPLYPRRLRVNVARHTAPRLLLTMLREVDKSIKLGRPTRVGPTGSV